MPEHNTTTADLIRRRVEFQREHPHVHLFDRRYPLPHAEAIWRDENDGQAIVIRSTMGALLDTLEALKW